MNSDYDNDIPYMTYCYMCDDDTIHDSTGCNNCNRIMSNN